MTDVRMFDYLEQYASMKDEILAAVERVLSSGQLILGPEVESFEAAFTAYLGAEGGSVGVNSGTDALVIVLRALGVGAGDEVVTVSNTAVPTVSAIREVGAVPVFCDVDPRTCLMDLDSLEAGLTVRTRAVVPVHLFGNVVDIPRLREVLGSRGIPVIEDCAQAHGAALDGRKVGTLGDAAGFSFYPTKNLGAFGDGGLCTSPDPELVSCMRSIRMYGFEDRYYSEREGQNSRLDELQAAVLNVKLRRLNEMVSRRRSLAAAYDRLLPEGVSPVEAGGGAEHAYHLYVVQVDDRERIRAELGGQGIATGIHYPFPIHRMRAYEFLGYGPGSLPVTEALAERILSLPLYPELPEEDLERVCAALASAVHG